MRFDLIGDMWHRIWFAPSSPAPVCLFRILFGFLAFCTGLHLMPDLMTFFGYDGIISVEAIQQCEGLPVRICLFFCAPQNEYTVFGLFIVMMLSSLTLCIGFRSNISAFVLFVCLVSFQHRNPFIFHSGDSLMRMCSLLLIFSPAGKMYSIDRWLSKTSDPEIMSAPWTQRLLQFQVAMVYFNSFWSKSGATWWNGTAVYYASRLADFQKLPVPFLLDQLWTINVLTWGTLAIECALWSLIWIKPIRRYVLISGILLHLGIDWTMNIPFFEHLMIACYVLFLEATQVESLVKSLKRVGLTSIKSIKVTLGQTAT